MGNSGAQISKGRASRAHVGEGNTSGAHTYCIKISWAAAGEDRKVIIYNGDAQACTRSASRDVAIDDVVDVVLENAF
jgi:hypothetical protein